MLRRSDGGPDGDRGPGAAPRGQQRPSRRRLLTRVLAWSLLPVALLLAAAGVFAVGVADVEPGYAVFDMAAVTGASPWLGALSTVGLGMWAAAGAVALLGARDDRVDPVVGRWLRRAGFVSLAAFVDDAYMVHEQLGLLVPGEEVTVLGLAGVAVLVALRDGRALLRRPDAPVLAVSALLLVASVVVDAVEDQLQAVLAATGLPHAWHVVVYAEESLKLCGIAVWLAYLVCLTTGRSALATVSGQRVEPRTGADVHAEDVYPGGRDRADRPRSGVR